MLFPNLYEEINMERYAKLALNMVPQRNIMVALCDDSGQIVWANNNKKKLEAFITNCNEMPDVDIVPDGCDYVERQHDGVNVVCCRLGELAGLPVGGMVFYDVGDDDSDAKGDTGEIASTLFNIAELVKAELHYLYEVNAMAKELGERYDELYLLRSSDLELTEHHESRHMLSGYIRTCADYLNADYASIWVPSRDTIYPGGIAYSHDSTDILPLLKQLSLSAYAMFQDGHAGFGINDKNEDLRSLIRLPADKKVLLVPVLDANGIPCGVLCCLKEFYSKDFTSSDQATLEAVSYKTYKYLLSTEDELTGFLNRKGFEESVWREVATTDCERYLVLFNLNQFSVINAAYGFNTGDRLLQAVAETITKNNHGLKLAARLEADMFAMLIEAAGADIEDQVTNICDEIDKVTISAGRKKLSVESRAGVILCNTKETAFADHLYAAETALLYAKDDSNKNVIVYQPGNTALMKRNKQLIQVENIKNALQEDRFELYCQRIQPVSGEEIHYEILVRMIGENCELVPPDEFIPIAERYNLMNSVDRWIIKRALQILSSDAYRECAANYKWGINLSGMSISDDSFHEYVTDCLHEYNFQPTNLYFEITETAAIKNFQHCVTFMNEIHAIGVQFALDDFGSGLSSFSYLKKLSIDYLKIDGSLVKDLVSSRLDQTMVSAIADIAKVLGVKTIAEYVENESILEVLSGLNIDYAQGYGIMKPQPVELELKDLAEHAKCKIYSNH